MKRIPNNQIDPHCADCGGYVAHIRAGRAVTFTGGYRLGDDVVCRECYGLEQSGAVCRL